MKKIYMAGVGGMLGEAFYNVFKSEYDLSCSDKDLTSDWLNYLDFRDRENYFKTVCDFKPDYLFHIGAHTSLEYCENHSDDAYNTNTISVQTAVDIANHLDIPLLYISTAGIFDGKEELYDDWATPNPLGVYARSKYMGERHVVENAKRYLVCRAGWMMGGGAKLDKKFIQKLMAQLKNGQKELKIVDDKDGTPTYTYDFANNVKLLLEREVWGLYNLVCGGETSRLDVANHLVEILKLDDIEVQSVPSSYFKTEYFAPRPPNERLINKKLNLMGLNIMGDWKESLTKYINVSYEDYLNG